MPLYLGFDCSTQGLTATLIDAGPSRRGVVGTLVTNFDVMLPHYGTRHGVLPSADPHVVHAPPLMWAEALDVTIARAAREMGVDLGDLRAISGSAQQHGSVYLAAMFGERLGAISSDAALASQLTGVLSRPTAPVWMDTSTTAECGEIEDALGGPRRMAQTTGSRAFERFTAPQIRKFAKESAGAWLATGRVHLVSSWLASLLVGAEAPLDHGDASGTALMTLDPPAWWSEAVRATAPGLERKLPRLAPSWTVAGTLAAYWQRRHGLPTARVVVWSGDNPCSLVGTGAVREGTFTISLGTSDTIFGPMAAPRVSVDGTGHVFASPVGGYMGMTVFQNGSLARERVRDAFGLDWSGFSAALASTPAGNNDGVMLPWFGPEITPPVLNPHPRADGVDPSAAADNVRAIVEGQMMAMALHSRWMGVPRVLHATGGASANTGILQVMADVFDATVRRLPGSNSAALGAALRAMHADHIADGRHTEWEEIVAGFTVPETDVRPVPANVEVYTRLRERYEALERTALGRADRRS